MSRQIKESVLFRTSAATDVQCSGRVIQVAGLKSISKKDITGIYQSIYKAEVVQVSTVTTSSITPAAATLYQVVVYDPVRVDQSYTESPKIYRYKTSNDLSVEGANAALQREYINLQLIAKINADPTCHATAATLTGGAGFTVTDDGGYYPVWSQSMTNVKGINSVYTIANPDGGGFAGDLAAITTPAVYSYGTGAKLLLQNPIVSFVFGNLISGVLEAPPVTTAGLPAVSGQNYDGFIITSLKAVPAIAVGGQLAYQDRLSTIFVDNGTGTATTNLSGFKAFERVMHKLMLQEYVDDASAVIEFFDQPLVFQDPLGAAPTGTANTLGWQMGRYTSLNRTNIGTQTIVAPVLSATGLLLDQDDTASEGSHTSANQQTLGDQSFVVGKSEYMAVARVVAADWTDTQFLLGIRKKAVYTADYNDYTDLAAIGGAAADGDSITTFGILNNDATVATDTAVNFADTVSSLLMIKVDIDGNVTTWANGVSYPIYSAGTTALVLDAGDEFIGFYQHLNIGGGDPAVTISEFFCVPTIGLIA
ncbi:MAG: hypothetical protein WC055_02105 [Melioribacteraceae bacterium]